MNPVFTQTIYYGIVMLISFVFIELLMQGFPHKFLRVFASLGRLSFIKVRNTTYDGLAIGREEDGFMTFKYNKQEHRLPIPNNIRVFYRFLFCQWVDVDGEKWAISKCDYFPVSSNDPIKTQNFFKRVLMAPKLDDNKMKMVLIGMVIVGIVALAGLIFNFVLMQKLDLVLTTTRQILTQGTTVTGATI
jgi:hypothetical protein